jgi:hypothetical protein
MKEILLLKDLQSEINIAALFLGYSLVADCAHITTVPASPRIITS